MISDRRWHQRQLDTDRRSSQRTPEYREVVWTDADADSAGRCGWLVDHSENGLAMLTESPNTPRPGTHIGVAVYERHRNRFESLIVTRTEQLSCLLDLVTAEYAAPPGTNWSQGHRPR